VFKESDNAVQQGPEGHPETYSMRRALSAFAKLKILVKGALIDKSAFVKFDILFDIQVKLYSMMSTDIII
jgi:hypothetical protein